MNLWTNEEIEKILVQLDQRKLPFEKYTCVKNQSSLQLLGRGSSVLYPNLVNSLDVA